MESLAFLLGGSYLLRTGCWIPTKKESFLEIHNVVKIQTYTVGFCLSHYVIPQIAVLGLDLDKDSTHKIT